MTQRTSRLILTAILILSAVLRLYGLDRMALWGDEACMVYLCRETPADIIGALAADDRPDVDVAPPLYFLMLHAWMSLLGSSVIAFRSFSVLFGVLTVWAVYRLSDTLFGSRVAWAAAFFTAINPFQIWYSQEGRMYALAGALAAAAMWGLACALKEPGRLRAWTGFALAGIALVYTQYYGALLMAALVFHAAWQVRYRADDRRASVVNLGIVIGFWTLAFAPWIPVLIRDYRHAGAPGGFPLMFHWLLTPAFIFIKSTLFGVEMYIRDNPWLYPVPILIAAALAVTALRHWRLAGVQMAGLAFLFPAGIIYSLSLLGMRVYKSHPFIIFQPALIVLMVYGWSRLKPRLAVPAAVVLIAAQTWVLATLVLGGDYVKPRTHHAADWILNQSGPGSAVAVMPAFMPNPMPIVGDLLAFRYHSGDRLNTLYLTGNTSADLTASILEHGRKQSPLYIVFQDNEHVRPFVDDTLNQLNQRWIRTDTAGFPSRSRGFSMTVIRYETRPIQDHQ